MDNNIKITSSIILIGSLIYWRYNYKNKNNYRNKLSNLSMVSIFEKYHHDNPDLFKDLDTDTSESEYDFNDLISS